jgi:general secretion pathway protein A
MKKRVLLFTLSSVLLSACANLPTPQDSAPEVGIAAKGGHPEYVFIAQISKDEAEVTARLVAQALAKGRLIIFSHMTKLNDSELGDKGFTPEYFAEQWMAVMAQDLINLTPAQQGIMDKLVAAGKQSIANNQERLNLKGVKWKNFLPATWARETGDILKTSTGIVIKQPTINYRHPANAPDTLEKNILSKFTRPGYDDTPYGEFTQMGKQAVYRYFEPVRLMPPCLACHGKPKGELDMLGFEKDGLEANDVIGAFSVTVGVKE